MRLILIGCEYTGKATLAANISRWMIEKMGVSLVRWHDHFIVPRLDQHTIITADGSDAVIGKREHDLNTDETRADQVPRPTSLKSFSVKHLAAYQPWPVRCRRRAVQLHYAERVYAPSTRTARLVPSLTARRGSEWRPTSPQAQDMVLVSLNAIRLVSRVCLSTPPRASSRSRTFPSPRPLREEYEAACRAKVRPDTTDAKLRTLGICRKHPTPLERATDLQACVEGPSTFRRMKLAASPQLVLAETQVRQPASTLTSICPTPTCGTPIPSVVSVQEV